MAGKLVQVATSTVSGSVANVTLTGINSDNVHLLAISKYENDTDNRDVWLRFTVGGTADTSSNYDNAAKELRSDTTFGNRYSPNQSVIQIAGNIGIQVGEQMNALIYLYNFNNSSGYSHCGFDTTYLNITPNHRGRQGGAVLTVNQATDGVQILGAGGNIDNGTFTLYKVV